MCMFVVIIIRTYVVISIYLCTSVCTVWWSSRNWLCQGECALVRDVGCRRQVIARHIQVGIMGCFRRVHVLV